MTANIWAAIENMPAKTLEALFDEDATRVDMMTISQSGLRFDFQRPIWMLICRRSLQNWQLRWTSMKPVRSCFRVR